MTISILLSLAMASSSPEPLILTRMADPDPTFVEPKAPVRKHGRGKRGQVTRAGPSSLDAALVNLLQASQERTEAVTQDYERQIREARDSIERAREAAENSSDAAAPRR